MQEEPTPDPEAVISRLIAEQTTTGNLLKEIRKAIDSDPEFQGLGYVGGIKAILKRYHEEKEKNLCLEKELNLLVRKKR